MTRLCRNCCAGVREYLAWPEIWPHTEATAGNCHYLRADATVEADRIRIIETAKRLFGRIDGVINNAGRAYRAPASETSIEEFRSLLEINLLAAFGLTQAAYEALRSRGAEFLTPPVDWGYEVRAFFRDPDGHLLEISQSGRQR